MNYYACQHGEVEKYSLTRGEFWDLACSVAAYLSDQGLAKGDRIVHSFSSNTSADLIFRLAATLVGCVPVAVNWQADDNERIIYKTKLTEARLMVYDNDFASRIETMKSSLPDTTFFEATGVEGYRSASHLPAPDIGYEDEKMVIFTSGSTGQPKGVSLPHRSYLANKFTFEQYFGMSESAQLDLLLVNPLHHTNSSALSDWGMRRSGTIIHLVQRYTTAYWQILTEVAGQKR